jgi:NAD(P)-dependent dehydrogenase (short-subunit alcohol dehydrogenase family)
MLLQGKTALVSGGGSGIGRAIAQVYAREGANVVISDVDEAGAEETLRLIGDGAREAEAIFVRADSGSKEDNESLVEAAVERYGALHVACNNAGISGEITPIAEHTPEGWERVIRINLSGVFYAMRAQIPRMLAAGGGSIVNISSILGQVGSAGSSAYTAAKHGVVGLTRTAALEYSARGVRVNVVGPGYIETPMLNVLSEEARATAAGLHPIGRLGTSEEVAELVLWLSSDRASFVTGAYYAVDGGYLAR